MTTVRREPATIVTFYSYKGGTGRSMALANLAWILAMNGRRVLTIDWDLEAPGLHRYFRPFLIDKDLESSTGVIDFVIAFAEHAVETDREPGVAASSRATRTPAPNPKWYTPHADISAHAISLEWEFPDGGGIDLVGAGRQDATYATRVSTFNWQNFYTNLGGGAFIDEMRSLLRRTTDLANPNFEPYDFVLIDSRTGVSDTAGICTVQLPDILVACFTYNNQGTDGAAAVAWSAQQQRRDPINARGGLRELIVYPVPMRVDPFERGRLSLRQQYAWQIFDRFLDHLPESRRKAYRADVEVPYVPLLSYEELLAVFLDEPEDPKFALGAFRRFATYAFGAEYSTLPAIDPEKRQGVLDEFASLSGLPAIVASSIESGGDYAGRRAEAVFQRLGEDDQHYARLLWLTMVRVTEQYETADLGVVRVRESDLPKGYAPAVAAFLDGGVVARETAGGVVYLAPASPSVVSIWPRLRGWIEDERPFLLWRQRLRARVEAKRNDDSDAEFLRGSEVIDALTWRSRKSLLPPERQFIWSSAFRFYARGTIVAVVALVTLLSVDPLRSILKDAVQNVYPFSRRHPPPVPPQSARDAARSEILAKRALSLPNDPLTAMLVLSEVASVGAEPKNAEQYRAAARQLLQRPVPRVILNGHSAAVRTVDFSPDGTLLLTAGDDGKVGVWGAESGDLRVWLRGPYPNPRGARFLSTSRIATVSRKAVTIFDAASGRFSAGVDWLSNAWLGGTCRELDGLVVIANERVFVISSSGVSAARPRLFTGLRSVAVGPGVLLAVNSGDKIRFWPLTGGPQAGITRSQLKAVGPMAFQPDGSLLFAAAGDWVWRLDPSSRVSHGVQPPLGSVTAIAVSPGGRHVAIGNSKGNVIVYDPNRDVIEREFNGHTDGILDIRFSPDGKSVATAAADRSVRVWSLAALSDPPTSFLGMAKSVANRTTVCLSAEQRALLLGDNAATAQARAAECEQQHGRVIVSGGDSSDGTPRPPAGGGLPRNLTTSNPGSDPF
jgi:hypothetical protein